MSCFRHGLIPQTLKMQNIFWIQQDWMGGPHDLTECWLLAKCFNLLDNPQVVEVKKHHAAKLIHGEHYFCIKHRELGGTPTTLSCVEIQIISGSCKYKMMLVQPLGCQENSNKAWESRQNESWAFIALLFSLPPQNKSDFVGILRFTEGCFHQGLKFFSPKLEGEAEMTPRNYFDKTNTRKAKLIITNSRLSTLH